VERLDESTGDELVVRDVSQLAQARAVVRDAARSAGLADERVDDAVLAASELVTNALEHGGGGDVVLSVTEAARSLEVTVSSTTSHTLPTRPLGTTDVSSPRGRGLGIVEVVTDGFNVEVKSGDPGTTTVRCRFAIA
jgi:serine/threonine-protein kinase RsbW